jgi:hypothetical protein
VTFGVSKVTRRRQTIAHEQPNATADPKPPQARSKCGADLTVSIHFVFCRADHVVAQVALDRVR